MGTYLKACGFEQDPETIDCPSDVKTRITDDVTFTNGILFDLRCKSLKLKSFPEFFQIIKEIVPPSVKVLCDELSEDSFRSKIRNFDALCFKKQKTPARFKEFLKDKFDFSPRWTSPRKRALQLDLKEAKTEIDNKKREQESASSQVILLKKELLNKETELDKSHSKQASTEKKIGDIKKNVTHMKKKIAGIESGKSRARAKSSVCTELFQDKGKNKKTQTEIKNVTSDIAILDTKVSSTLYEGVRYYGYEKGKKKLFTSNKCYAEISTELAPSSTVTRKVIQSRARYAMEIIGVLASPTNDEAETQLLITEMMRCNSSIFNKAGEKAGVQAPQLLSPEQAVSIQSLLRLPMNKVRNLRRGLANLNVFPSERKMRAVQKNKTTHVSSLMVESGLMGLKRTAKEEVVRPRPFVRVTDLARYLTDILSTETDCNFQNRFDGCLWLLFAGDKGGNHMKFHFECINSSRIGSVDNVHMYSMYEAADTNENMWKVWLPYREQLARIQEDDFRLLGRKVVVFLGGDYHFLDDMMGHQGSSSTYPSSTDLVHKDHLQNHGGEPHHPDVCPVERRTVDHYNLWYNNNLADSRNNNDLHENGKHHYNVFNKMLFPITDIERIVPPGLHIRLGVVLLVYNLLLGVCQELDRYEESIEVIEEQHKISEEWEEASCLYQEHLHELHEQSEAVVEMENRLGRLQAAITGNSAEIAVIAQKQDSRRKGRKNLSHESCESDLCIMTKHDINVLWVQCDTCDGWYHTLCECLSASEEISVLNQEYKCLKCSDVTNREEVIRTKVSAILSEQNAVKEQCIAAEGRCHDLKSKYTEFVGKRENTLITALDSMNVVRQAYHGNVFVGNHCNIILKQYNQLTEAISDDVHLREKFNDIFATYRSINDLVSAKRFLTEQEIKKCVDLCTRFGSMFPIYFPERNITRKIHALIYDVPIFVQRYGTLGLLSEQEGESLHAAVNQELRALAGVRSHPEKIRLVLERQELRTQMDKSMIQAKSRLCIICKEKGLKHFLKCGKDGQKHCVVCQPAMF